MLYTAPLTCHPDAHSQAVRGIEARVAWTRGGVLSLTYSLKGDLSLLRIRPPRAPRRADRLWKHTCFEAFISLNGTPEYYEFNFAPWGEWAAYGFRCYRERAWSSDEALAPQITTRSGGKSFELDAVVRVARLLKAEAPWRLRIGLAAVIEEHEGLRSYWALKHPAGKPDFHHPDAFALEFGAPAPKALKPTSRRAR